MYNKVLWALAFSVASTMIIFSNKIVLTSYKFTSFQTLAIGQLIVTIIAIKLVRMFRLVKVKNLNLNLAWKIKPLILISFGNLLFGLGGTKSLNLPMFTVLRRFSILMTLYGELFILKTKKSFMIQACTYLMVVGALIAALDDLTFDVYGYTYIVLNNIFTAANGIYTKKNLDKTIDEYDILFYTSVFSIGPMIFLSFLTGEYEKLLNYDQWSSAGFWFFFIVSSLMGFVLNYSTMMCTKYNSPLTTSVIGCLKNILVTYIGMFIGGDYLFSWLNFVGLSISSLASLLFTYFTFSEKSKPSDPVKAAAKTKKINDKTSPLALKDRKGNKNNNNNIDSNNNNNINNSDNDSSFNNINKQQLLKVNYLSLKSDSALIQTDSPAVSL